MKKYFAILIFILPLFTTYSQKLKKDFTNVKYFRPAIYHEPLSRYFNIITCEKRMELDSSISEINKVYCNYSRTDARAKFYMSNFRMIPEFFGTGHVQPEGEADTISALFIKTGRLRVTDKEPYSEKVKDSQGKVTGVKWFLNVMVQVPVSMQFSDENGRVIIKENKAWKTITYNYPKQFPEGKIAAFGSKKQLIDFFERNKVAFLQKVRDYYIADWADYVRKKIHHTFNDDEDLIGVDFAYIKGQGKMKKAYDDVNDLSNRLNDLFSLIKLNFKNENKLNWHTEEIQKEFATIETELERILNEDLETKEKGGENRFDDAAVLGIYKNILWCKFFTGKFKEVIEIADKLYRGDQIGAASFEIETKIYWSNLLEAAKTYQVIYEKNKERLNWY